MYMYTYIHIYIYICFQCVYIYIYIYSILYVYVYMWPWPGLLRPRRFVELLSSSALFSVATPSPPIKSFPIKSPWVKLSGKLPIKFNGQESAWVKRFETQTLNRRTGRSVRPVEPWVVQPWQPLLVLICPGSATTTSTWPPLLVLVSERFCHELDEDALCRYLCLARFYCDHFYCSIVILIVIVLSSINNNDDSHTDNDNTTTHNNNINNDNNSSQGEPLVSHYAQSPC